VRNFSIVLLCAFFLAVFNKVTFAQSANSINSSNVTANRITTAVPFLNIVTDSRVAAMGEAGVATAPDANSASINPAKLSFLDKDAGVGLFYSPWLKSLVDQVDLLYLSGYYKLNASNTISASLRYFSMGNVQLTGGAEQDLGRYHPNEFSIDASYIKKMSDNFSLATTLKYIRSNVITAAAFGDLFQGSSAVAVDVSGYLQIPVNFKTVNGFFSTGFNVSNIGSKLQYSKQDQSYPLPSNLKLGSAYRIMPDDVNEFTIALDFNKLLVPLKDHESQSVSSGIFSSFTDAPDGFKEELSEVSLSFGLEYKYKHAFALRGGYMYEDPKKGDRRYLTMGGGFIKNGFSVDLAYILADVQRSPFANTIRLTILLNFGDRIKGSYENKSRFRF
jgi:hypothetical protein